MKRRFAIAALLLAAAPLHSQDARPHRFEGGTFSIELPAGLPALQLLREGGTTTRVQFFAGRHLDGSVVVVMRSHSTGPAADTVGRRRRATQVLGDTALVNRYVEFGDTSQAYRDSVRSALADTTLETRKFVLQQARTTLLAANQSAWIELTGAPREIVSDDRVTLRSPATLRLEGLPPLQGTVDMMIQRRGGMVLWIVARAAPRRTPAFDAATERILDSFRITQRP